MKDAVRAKAERLVRLLKKLDVEFVVVPELEEIEATRADELSFPAEMPARDVSVPASAASPVSESPAPEIAVQSPRAPASVTVNDKPPWKEPIEKAQAAVPVPARVSDVAIDPLPLDGVLDPAFRLERSESWLSAIVLVPWRILAATLQALAPTLDRSFDICKAHFWGLFAIAGIPWILVAGVALIVIVVSAATGLTAQSLLDLPVWLLVIGVIVAIPTVVVGGALFLFWPHAALIHAVSEIYLGRDIEVVQAYRFAFTKIIRYVLTSYLVILVTLGLFMAAGLAAILVLVPFVMALGMTGDLRSPFWLVIVGMATATAFLLPLVICLPRLFFFDKIVMIEDSAYGESLKRSWRLLAGRSAAGWYTSYYAILGILLLVLIPLQWGILFLFEGPALLLNHLMPGPKIIGSYSGQVVSTFGSLMSQIYSVAVSVLFYYCIRSRKEGHDLLALAETDDTEHTE
jgi:hypothetical protein